MEEIEKSQEDYINEILLWCGVVRQCSVPTETEHLSDSEQQTRHRAIMALHFTTQSYLNRGHV